MYDLDRKTVFHSRNVVFREDNYAHVPEKNISEESSTLNVRLSDMVTSSERESDSVTEGEESEEAEPTRKSERNRRPPDRYGDWTYICQDTSEPASVQEALNGPKSHKWREAMQDEISVLHKNKVWDLVALPEGKKPIQSRWIFRKKISSDGSVSSYKARFVAKDFQQTEGIDYDDIFSPVVRFESVRTVLALAAENDLHAHHMDVSNAFLNSKLDSEVFMTQPATFSNNNLVCKLNKSIYGLKQSPKCWNFNLDAFIKQQGFSQSNADACIYTKITSNDLFVVAVYVADIIIASKSMNEIINKLKSSLCKNYQMKDLGKLEYFLGVNVSQNNGGIFIHQSAYINSLLSKYHFANAKSVSTPVDCSSYLEKATDSCQLFDIEKYQSTVGSLLYLSTRTRPDITYAVCNVAKFCSKPTVKHWTAVKSIFRYLKGTIIVGVLYKKQRTSDSSNKCIGFSEADWAGDRADRKSTSGYCFRLNNGLISWRTNKQSCVALSTAEAEYVALSSAAQEAVWFKQLISDLNVKDTNPLLINEDNQSAISIAKNSKCHGKTKHINIKYHFVRDLVQKNVIELKYRSTNEMIADLFTKPIASEKFSNLCSMLGLTSLPSI